MTKRSEMSKWCIIRSNGTLRTLIVRKMEELNLTMAQLSEKSGVPYDKIRQYLKVYKTTKGMTQFEVLTVCNVLGIKISLDIQLKYPNA